MYLTVDSMWLDTIKEILTQGKEIKSRYGMTKEIMGFSKTLVSTDSTFLLNSRRKLSPVYACAEFLWYLKPTKSIEMIKAYAPQYAKFAENGEAHGAYGWRLAYNCFKESQLLLLVEHLKRTPDSRQAILTCWTADDLWHAVRDKRKDLPCTISLQFLIRDKKLHLIVTMRSNDAWLGLPYDIFAFTCIQRVIGRALGVPCGTYTHQAGSEHLYEKNWKAAKEALKCCPRVERLTHDWLTNEEPKWHGHIQQALLAEGRYRNGLDGNAEARELMNPLFDVVQCAARPFGWKRLPISPVLQEAINHVNS